MRGGKAAIAAKKAKENKSFGEKLKSGIRSLGSDIAMGVGAKDKTDDYIRRTANTVAVNRAVQRGDSSGLSDDLQSRYRREKMMADMSRGRDKRQRDAQQTADQAPDMTDQYAENLRRYNEYMQSQQQPRQPRVTPDMRREALNIFESQQGAGQMPYYMAAARQGPNASPAFNYAAQNYATLGGAQRLAPRPMEMMSVAERQQINRMAEGMVPQPVPMPMPMPMPSPEDEYQQGMDMVMGGGGKGGPRTGPQLPPGMVGLPRTPDYGGRPLPPGMVGLPRTPDYGGRPQQPPSRFSPFINMLASRFGGTR